ncbi:MULTISPECIES: aldehyde dehydrogenase family protein [Pseudomonas]|uniref:aldehyde dehydrogenase family protein n=1 Tax=Pseudomonas TaxID=286 RepID=UPI003905C628
MISPIKHLTDFGRLDRAFIDGEWILPVFSGRTAVIDPSTEEPVAEIALGGAADVDRAVAAARRIASRTGSLCTASARVSWRRRAGP